ncbi:hypothetical protein CA267_012090 [Alteromonas pelagimontana]|uniref:Uncharacterized protein n=1 Tax=Alteromonas pelagimontana TaxID=1858656 RepID=A0A6M4MEP5_9ALTE|nr:hypothetical protein [Alteromonas pelagimontana]QJR81467.1 hypothetical protein CA267_012090 [Alteromonas pelagimontana]
MSHPFFSENHLTDADTAAVAGGNISRHKLIDASLNPVIRPVEPPYYITLAIGEDGGKLPDLETF